MIDKWEKYVSDHETYKECYQEFTEWASDAKEKLDACRKAEPAKEKPTEPTSLEVSMGYAYRFFYADTLHSVK